MEEIRISAVDDKRAVYEELLPQLVSLVAGEPDVTANLANLAAALKQSLRHVSWVGFYLMKAGELVVGPFQGKVACTRIALGRGVCGTSASEKRTLIVPNVNEFPGHIFCDPDSKSEIVVPLVKEGNVLGVLDLDSAEFGSFDDVDGTYLGEVSRLAVRVIDGG